MAWLAVNKNGSEVVSPNKPTRTSPFGEWEEWDFCDECGDIYKQSNLPKGSIEKLIGKELTWEDEPVEI